jgi:hypothetical protein
MSTPNDNNIVNWNTLSKYTYTGEENRSKIPSSTDIAEYLNKDNVNKFIAYRNLNTGFSDNASNPTNIYNLLQIVEKDGIVDTVTYQMVAQINILESKPHVYEYPDNLIKKTMGGRSRQRKTLARKNRKSRSRKNRKSRSRKNRK